MPRTDQREERSERAEILARLRRDAERIATQFGLSYRAIYAENVKSRYGVCYSDGLIKLRLSHATTGRPLKYSSLIDTVCHELAHLRHFNHGPEFKAFFFELLGWARRQGIYRPGRPGAGAPAEAALGEARRAPRTERRNGVPVFPHDPAPRGDLNLLPWERWQQLLGQRSEPRANHRAQPAPSRTEVTTRITPARVVQPPRPARVTEPPARLPAREQLSLF